MTQKLKERNGVVKFEAVSGVENFTAPGGIPIDARRIHAHLTGGCHICGRHISELKPFGGPGDPLEGDFSGHVLVERRRPVIPYIEEADHAWKEAERVCKEVDDEDRISNWFIAEYGKEEGESLYGAAFSMKFVKCFSLECRDCIVLDDNESWKILRKRYEDREDD